MSPGHMSLYAILIHHARTHARTHACTHARTRARARAHTHTHQARFLQLMVNGEFQAADNGGISMLVFCHTSVSLIYGVSTTPPFVSAWLRHSMFMPDRVGLCRAKPAKAAIGCWIPFCVAILRSHWVCVLKHERLRKTCAVIFCGSRNLCPCWKLPRKTI